MKTLIVLAMHGAPAIDFPMGELNEFMDLHNQLEGSDIPGRASLQRRYSKLEHKMRIWPRTPENDPYYAASQKLGEELMKATGHDVIVGFNEFCSPSVDDALCIAAQRGAGDIIVVTPMTTGGGEHSEKDIPEAIQRAQQQHPNISISYAWPFEPATVAQFLSHHLSRFIDIDNT